MNWFDGFEAFPTKKLNKNMKAITSQLSPNETVYDVINRIGVINEIAVPLKNYKSRSAK